MVNLYKQDGETLYGIKEYIVDSLNDVKDLPKNVKIGSIALIISTGQVYIFNGEKKWTPIGNSSSEGSNATDCSCDEILDMIDSDDDGIVDTSGTSNSST